MKEEQTNNQLAGKQLAEIYEYIRTVVGFLNGEYRPEGEMREAMEEEAQAVCLGTKLHDEVRSIFLEEGCTDDVGSRLAAFVAVIITRYMSGLAPAFVYGERKE